MKTNAVKLTTDQETANNAFLDFLVSDENFFVIQGAAGTGKSFLIKHLLETFHSKYSAYCLLLQQDVKEFDVKVTATTNKAVTVVDDFLTGLSAKAGDVNVCTIFSLLGLKVVNNIKTGKTELQYTKNTSANQIVDNGKTPLVFIDEASFIDEDLQVIINEVLRKEHNAKVVYIGDKYQLAPIGQSQSVMDTIKCTKVSLNEIMRNGGHILETGTQFRNTVETGSFNEIIYNDFDVHHVDGPAFQDMVESSFRAPGWTPGTSKVLAWTNARVQQYNAHIRQALGRPEMFEVGEVVITNEFIKGRNFTRGVDSEVMITNINSNNEMMYDVEGKLIEIDNTYVGFMPINFQHAKNLMKNLAREKEWKKYFEVKETWLDLRPVYASSIHKSQGSTYETVFLDLADIGKNWNGNDVARLLYVGITRASKQVVCYGYLPDRYCY